MSMYAQCKRMYESKCYEKKIRYGGNTAIIIAGQCRSLIHNLKNIRSFCDLYSKETKRYCEHVFYIDAHVNFPWQEDATLRKGDLCTVKVELAIRRIFPSSHIHFYNPNDIHSVISEKQLNEAAYLYFQSLVEHRALAFACDVMPNITHILKLRPDATYTLDFDFSLFSDYDNLILKDWDMCFHCTKGNADIVCNQMETIEDIELASKIDEAVTIHNIHYVHLFMKGLLCMDMKVCTLNRIMDKSWMDGVQSRKNNVYIPIGIQCSSAELLKRTNMRRQSFPFDWVFCSLRFVYNVLYSYEASMFVPDTMVEFGGFEKFKTSMSGYYHASKAHGVVYPHENDGFNGEKFAKRLLRMKQYIENNDCTKVFVYSTHITPDTAFVLDGVECNKTDPHYLRLICDLLDSRHTMYKVLVIDWVSMFSEFSHPNVTIVQLTPSIPENGFNEPPFLAQMETMIDTLYSL